ncbi:MAG: 50S ribosomal protein L9 [Pseudomonadota bacterium]|nr:50S ribosomal protein L9 [Pseudomonadota bacterium]
MKIILLERVPNLGQMGDVVTVKNGYARNYLLPQGKAERATDSAMKAFETRRSQLEAKNLAARAEAEDMAGRMTNVSVALIRQASDMGQLYGSVSTRDIAEAVTAAGYTVDRKQVELVRPIKTIGIHEVTLRLHPEVTLEVTVNVARSEGEAQAQARGEDVLRPDDDDDDFESYPGDGETEGEDGEGEPVARKTAEELLEAITGRKLDPSEAPQPDI